MTITEFVNNFEGYQAGDEGEVFGFDSTETTPKNALNTIGKIRVSQKEYEILDEKLRELLGVKMTKKTVQKQDEEGQPMVDEENNPIMESYYEVSSDSMDAIDSAIQNLQESTLDTQRAVAETQRKVTSLEGNTSSGAYVYRGSLADYSMIESIEAVFAGDPQNFIEGADVFIEISADGKTVSVYSKVLENVEGEDITRYIGADITYSEADDESTTVTFDDMTEEEFEEKNAFALASGSVFNIVTTGADGVEYSGMNYAYNDGTGKFDALGGILNKATAADYNEPTGEETEGTFTGGSDGLMSAKDKAVIDNISDNNIVTGSVDANGVLSFSSLNAKTGETVEI